MTIFLIDLAMIFIGLAACFLDKKRMFFILTKRDDLIAEKRVSRLDRRDQTQEFDEEKQKGRAVLQKSVSEADESKTFDPAVDCEF